METGYQLRAQMGRQESNSLDEIKAFLKTLKGRDRFGNPLANYPVLIKGGFLYRLDKKGELEKIKVLILPDG
jgi:hypothetical protein